MRQPSFITWGGLLAGLFACAACGGVSEPETAAPVTPGEVLSRGSGEAELSRLKLGLTQLGSEDAAGLLSKHAPKFQKLGSEVRHDAVGMKEVQASPLSLSKVDLAKLDENGFVIDRSRVYPSFHYGYAAIYMADLPVYVSADSVLHALHRSYDNVLANLERQVLESTLSALLDGLRRRLPASAAPESVKRDLDVYLAVARSLLNASGARVAPVAGGDAQAINSLVGKAMDSDGASDVSLFGVSRTEDFSQFKPRGHYTDGLEPYFRAMMWLGRIDLRMIETQPDGTQLLRRPQADAAVALASLMGDSELQGWKRLDQAVTAFVGEQDYMTVPQVAPLLAALKTDEAGFYGKPDGEVGAALAAGGFGLQKIASHVMINDGNVDTLPLNLSFALLGQRYIVDSHVLSQVVWDRTKEQRMMPSALDAAFAALGNDQAGQLLKPELERFKYAPQLAGARFLVDEHGPQYFEGNLYTTWLGALRTLSPGAGGSDGLPPVARTEAWGRRLLNTQLASWAELRRDTILYAKQSYTGGAGCEFPDAYVEPYPALWAKVGTFAKRLSAATAGFDPAAVAFVQDYASRLGVVAGRFQRMAESQRSGSPHSAEDLAFINQVVRTRQEPQGCIPVNIPDGWYKDLFLDPNAALEADPTIADIHTQPTDEAGNMVGNVYHVTTGLPRAMVVTVESCTGLRAYVGLVSDYGERFTTDFQRLNDEEWQKQLGGDGAGSNPPEFLKPIFGD